MRTIFVFLITTLIAITRVYGLNDWGEPCTSGVCHYDLDSSQGASSGTLKIWGSYKAISDITPAAGWHILDCKEDDLEQLVRIVCVSQSAPCSHLFSHSGPEGKIVRLPTWCGRNPFARVARSWVSYDQSIPRRLASQLRKRDGPVPVVYNLVLDVKFSDVDPQHGPIRFAIQAATIPNTNTHIDTHLPLYKRSGRPIQRSHEDIVARASATVKRDIEQHLKDIQHGFKTAVHDTKDEIKKGVTASRKAVENARHAIQANKAVDNVVHAAVQDAKGDIDKVVHKTKNDIQKGVRVVDKVVHKVEGNVQKGVHKAEVDIPKYVHGVVNATEHPKATFESAVKGAKKLVKEAEKLSNFTKTIHFSPQFSGRNITLLKQTFNCPPTYPGFQVDLNPNGNVNGTIGLAVSGTIIPPHVDKFQIVTSLEADVTAVLTMVAELTIIYDSGQRKIFEFPLAGIDFPGIMSLGPKLQLFVQLRMLFDIVVGTRLNIGFQVQNLVLDFPKTRPTPQPNIELKKGSFGLTSTPFVRGALQGDVHFIPTLAIGLDILGKFQTSVYFQIDTMLVQYLRVEQLAKTQNIKPREFKEAEGDSSNVVFDVNGLLHDMPLVAKSATELALRSWHGRDHSNMEITKHSGAEDPTFPSLHRRLTPGPAPWPGGTAPLSHVNSTDGPAIDACLETFFILDVVAGLTDEVPILKLDQNSQIAFFRKVKTLDMNCVGTLQPNGHYDVNSILNNLNNLKSHPLRRSEGTSTSSFLGHKCDGITRGMGMMTSIGGDNYVAFSLSHTGRI